MSKKVIAKVSKAKVAAKKTPIKKTSSKSKSASVSKASKTSSSAKSSKSTSYQKTITMYKTQPDYFVKNKKYENMGIGTRLIHAGNEPDNEFGGVSPAINMSTTYAQPAPGEPVVFDYARCGNPTRLCFERNLAAMEKGKYAFACSSGMSAHITIMNMLSMGDHILCVDDVYGGTQRYLRTILSPHSGIDVTLCDFSNITEFKKHI